MKLPTHATLLTGKALPAAVAYSIDHEAQSRYRWMQDHADHDRLVDAWTRGAVAGYCGNARAVSASPQAIAHRDGHDYGSQLRRQAIGCAA